MSKNYILPYEQLYKILEVYEFGTYEDRGFGLVNAGHDDIAYYTEDKDGERTGEQVFVTTWNEIFKVRTKLNEWKKKKEWINKNFHCSFRDGKECICDTFKIQCTEENCPHYIKIINKEKDLKKKDKKLPIGATIRIELNNMMLEINKMKQKVDDSVGCFMKHHNRIAHLEERMNEIEKQFDALKGFNPIGNRHFCELDNRVKHLEDNYFEKVWKLEKKIIDLKEKYGKTTK